MRLSALMVASLLLGTACAKEIPPGARASSTPPPISEPLPVASSPSPRIDAGVAPAASVAADPPAPLAPWAVANRDPDDDGVVGPPEAIPDCLDRLTALGVHADLARLPVHQDGKRTCGAPQVVTYKSGPVGLRWSSAPMVTCAVALGLSRFEQIASEEAQKELGTAIKRITHLGTYSCRPMVRFNLASEHSYANAIDIEGFDLEGGKRITIEHDWGNKDAPPATPAARFLRAVARRTYDESVFSVVLGPPWDALHKNHLHLDQARYRVDGLIVQP